MAPPRKPGPRGKDGRLIGPDGLTSLQRAGKRRWEREKAKRKGVEPPQEESSLRWLQSEVDRLKKEALSAKAIRREIFKLAEAEPHPPAWVTAQPRKKGLPGVPTLFLSDWHWGEVVNPDEIGGVNEFDLKIAHRRAQMVIQNAVDLLTNHMVNPDYPGIVVALGGDMVSGDIHDELRETNECQTIPAVLDLWGVLIQGIETLAARFGRVFVPCVTGNHGRNTMKIRAKERAHTSYDWLLYQLLEKHFEHDGRVEFLIPAGPDASWSIYGHRYLMTHGDQFRGGDGMIGALGPIIRGDHKKRSRAGQIGQEYDTMILGHWHQLVQMRRVIVNGSLKGYDEYAFSGNFGFEDPQQALWITHPERGITFQMAVHVSEKRPASRLEWVSWPKVRK